MGVHEVYNCANLIDEKNALFWDELCGSSWEPMLGITTERNLSEVLRYDSFYFEYYPYLLKHVNLDEIKGKSVLEIGLGYGSLTQKLAQTAGEYVGMDVSPGPVQMANYRIQENGLQGQAIQCSVLKNSIESNSKDYVVSIGCFHHTSDVTKCIDETYRILKPGGTAIIMVYNRFSYRQWIKWPLSTLKAALGLATSKSSEEQKWMYDHNSNGEAAPETVFLSIKELKTMLSKYSKVTLVKENLNISKHGLRWFGLKTVGRIAGLDIYIRAQK